jgi:hypothetical protein
MNRHHCWALVALAYTLLISPTIAGPTSDREKPDIDLYALMSGKCPTLTVAGRDFACRAVAYFHSEKGRANFTVALDDPDDHSHIISFSGEDGRRTQADRYLLTIDRMELNSQDRPKVDGLPVPALEPSAGTCQQSGNFAKLQVSRITCVATDERGQQYRLQFESDGAPLTLRRVRASAPTIRQDPYF